MPSCRRGRRDLSRMSVTLTTTGLFWIQALFAVASQPTTTLTTTTTKAAAKSIAEVSESAGGIYVEADFVFYYISFDIDY